nr:MAG: RNA-dependent RNA polymerase [Riboviria sp.]
MFTLPSRAPLTHINDVMRDFPHGETSPGLPYTLEGVKHKRDVDPYRIKFFVHKMKYGLISNCRTPCTAASRTTVSKAEKFRLIWVYPCHMTMAEGIFAQGLINRYKAFRTSYAIWCQYAKGHMKYLASFKTTKTQKWFNVDWSRFDANVPAWLIRDAFDILRDQIDFSRYRDYGTPTDPDTIPRLWNRIVHYFINTPMKLPDGRIRVKAKGVPSGSYFTNLIDTIVSAIVARYIFRVMDTKFMTLSSWFMGDDACMLTQSGIDTKRFATLAKTCFGFELNTSKSEVSDTLSFLGYRSTARGVPIASFEKLLAQLLLPSGKDQCLGDFIVRARALQLSCFGVGCMKFTRMVDDVLDTLPYEAGRLHWRDECTAKLEFFGLGHWPPLNEVMGIVA